MGHRIQEKVSNISRTNGCGVPFYNFAQGYDGLVTEGEKAAAERGAAARGTYGAKRDKCKQGKSCGAACIFYRKDCVLELDVNVSNAIRGARALILREMNAGKLSAEEAEQKFLQKTNLGKVDPNKQLGIGAKDVQWEMRNGRMVRVRGRAAEGQYQLSKATGAAEGDLAQRRADVMEAIRGSKEVKGLREQFPDAKERSAKIRELFNQALDKGYGIYGENYAYRAKRPEVMSEEFAKGVLNNQNFISKVNAIEASYKAGNITTAQFNKQMDEAKSFMFTKDHSPAEVLMMSAFLSPGARNYLMTAGNTKAANIYDSRFPDRQAMPTGQEKGTSKDVKRAWMMQNLKTMMDTNFKEVYSQLPYKIHQVDLEHLVPEEFSKALGGANVGGNKAFAFSHANQTRGKAPLSFFLKGESSGLFSGKYFNQEGTTVTSSAGKSSLKTSLEKSIKERDKDVNSILKTIAGIPAKDLNAKDRMGMIAKVVSEYARDPYTNKPFSRSVTVGLETERGREKSYHWFGGKNPGWSGAQGLGERMAQAVGKWESQGDEGARKMIELAGLMRKASNSLLKINDIEVNGQPIRRQLVTAPGVKETREAEFESRMKSIMPEFDALLSS